MKRFKFHIPCTEVWVVQVDAYDEDAAWNKVRKRQYQKLYSSEGNTPTGKTELVAVHTLREKRSKNEKRT